MDSQCRQCSILWVGPGPVPPNVREAAGRWELVTPGDDSPLDACFDGAAVALLDEKTEDFENILRRLRAGGAVVVVLDAGGEAATVHEGVLPVRRDTPAAQLAASLQAACSLAPSLGRLRAELREARVVASEASRTAEQIDEEMRMACRLQQDFLPRQLPKVGPVRFAVRYISAGFVSGDIYDVTRLDETHVGFYVADAVGHGMPAALMTMFIKKALQTKRISGHSYEIIPPHESLAQLNLDLCRQKLTMCEFCTVIYGVIDTSDMMLTISRAGHPAPLLMHTGGQWQPLDIEGSLLGILDDARFESRRFQLAPGDRLLLYSDGVEDTICGKGSGKQGSLVDAIKPLSDLPRDELLGGISQMVPTAGACDDVTLLLAEIE